MGDQHLERVKPKKTGLEPPATLLDAPQVDPQTGPAGARRAIIAPAQVDLGVLPVGSRPWFDICQLVVADGFRGQVVAFSYLNDETFRAKTSDGSSVAGAATAFMPDSAGQPVVSSTDQLQPVQVRFAPKVEGTYDAELHVRADWSDGQISDKTVSLRARADNDARRDDGAEVATPSHSTAKDQADKDATRVHDPAQEQVRTAADEARDAANAVSEARRRGVGDAEKEADSYKEPIPEDAWWMELAEIAISMGTQAIVSMIVKGLSEVVVTKVLDTTVDAVKNRAVYVGVVDSMKEGMKATRKAYLPKPERRPNRPRNPRRNPPERSPRIHASSSGEDNKRVSTKSPHRTACS